jgi:hypothetical protein
MPISTRRQYKASRVVQRLWRGVLARKYARQVHDMTFRTRSLRDAHVHSAVTITRQRLQHRLALTLLRDSELKTFELHLTRGTIQDREAHVVAQLALALALLRNEEERAHRLRRIVVHVGRKLTLQHAT